MSAVGPGLPASDTEQVLTQLGRRPASRLEDSCAAGAGKHKRRSSARPSPRAQDGDQSQGGAPAVKTAQGGARPARLITYRRAWLRGMAH